MNLLATVTIVWGVTASLCFAKESSQQMPAKGSEAGQVMTVLKDGNKRFISGQVRSDGQAKADIARLASGQNPRAVVLSCSDSRVPPELVFDQKLGELFTVRTAGETLSPQAVGSIEYAIEKLGSPVIVVLGHTQCGAVKATLETWDGQSAGSENLDRLVEDIRPRLKGKIDPKSPTQDLKKESWTNARGVAEDLLKRSSLIAKAVASGKVKIEVGLYNLATGKVDFE